MQKVKEEIMKQVDQLEEKNANDLSGMKQRRESRLNEEKTEITRLTNQVIEGKEQIEFQRETWFKYSASLSRLIPREHGTSS